MQRRSMVALLGGGLLGAAAPQLRAQTKFPTRTLQLSVPTGGGSGGDLWARALIGPWGDELGQSMIVDNRPGGGGMISIDYVAHSNPDGHVLLMGNSSLVTNQLMFRKVPYDAFADLVPIGRIGIAPLVFVAEPSLGINSMQDFIRMAKGRNFAYGSFAVGSTQHLFAHLLSEVYGLGMTHVAYKGEAAAMPDLLAGRIQCGFFTVTSVKGFVRSGKLKALGMLTPQRATNLPDVPTLLEQGLDPRFSWLGWIAVFAPSKTPKDAQAKLTATMEKVIQRADVRARLEEQDMLVQWATPEQILPMEHETLETMRTLRSLAKLTYED